MQFDDSAELVPSVLFGLSQDWARMAVGLRIQAVQVYHGNLCAGPLAAC